MLLLYLVLLLLQLVVGNIRYEIKNTSLPTSKGRRGYSRSFRKTRHLAKNSLKKEFLETKYDFNH